ncbi:MAG TPA: fibronectin type III domain-containing protein [Gaiellaceae bacterium]|nr:fibronectin type III domain-containing protein [Gaiellaceae bacterium]
MPLRHICWPLLAVVAGTAIGLKIGLPSSGGAVSASPSSLQQEAAAGLAFAPATQRRPVKPVGLYTGREVPIGLHRVSSVEAASTVASDDGAGTGSTAFSAPYARDLTFMAFPSAASFPASGAPEGSATTTTPAAPSGPPPTISDVRTVALTPFSATLSWGTSETATSRAVYGLDTPVVWTAPTDSATTHQLTLSGLSPASTYHLDVTATTADGRSSVSQFLLTTPALFGSARLSTGGGAVLLDGQPAFPKLVWNQCPDAVAGNLSVGVDFFMGNGCGSSAQLATWLSGSAIALGDAREAAPARAGAVGTFLPDEWDTHLPNDFTAADANRLIPPSPGSGPRFLTLTNHFYRRAAPLPQGRGMYPGLVAAADVVGFDLYPLQNWCRLDSFGDVFDSQLDLVALARGRPTFQWIEARQMDCSGAELVPTAETLRAEAWLSIAGGAHAIGYFPNDWSAAVGTAIAQVNHEISTLTPALVEPPIAASASLDSTVRVGARDHNGAVYVIAVNASRSPATATITVPALVDRTLVTLDGRHEATAKDGAFTATFAPLEARIYIAAPSA